MNDPMSDKNACQLTWPHSINTILLLFECTMHKPSEQLYFDFWLCFVFHDDECTKSKTESSVQGGGDILPPHQWKPITKYVLRWLPEQEMCHNREDITKCYVSSDGFSDQRQAPKTVRISKTDTWLAMWFSLQATKSVFKF